MWLGSDDGPICAHNASFEHFHARVLVVFESSLGKEATPNAVVTLWHSGSLDTPQSSNSERY
jgi:hypothetical protein